ncbi:hypothetical protein Tco_0300367 [Tanacetum coccineum]
MVKNSVTQFLDELEVADELAKERSLLDFRGAPDGCGIALSPNISGSSSPVTRPRVLRAFVNSGRYGNERQTGKNDNQRAIVVTKSETIGNQVVQQTRMQCFNYDKPVDQEFEAHYMYMAKIPEVIPAADDDIGPAYDTEPFEKADRNITLDSFDMSFNKGEIHQNAEQHEDERVLLASMGVGIKSLLEVTAAKYKGYNCSKIKTVERVSTVKREWINTEERINIDWRLRVLTWQMLPEQTKQILKPENGNAPPLTKVVEGVETIIAPTTAEEKTQRSSEVLDQTFDRLQKLISQLDIHGESISQEDVNLKFLRSLSPEWNTHTIVWRNKPEIDTLSLDDLYNNLNIYEPEVKETSSSITNIQNVAFVSSNSTNRSNGAVNTAHDATTASTQATVVNSTTIDNLSDAVICAFFASQPNSPQLNNEDL